MRITLTFLGAAGVVTGSKYLLSVEDNHYLIDCGLFQGAREWKSLNWEPLPIPPSHIQAVLLTHAHIDHSGYLPRLAAQGFRGAVYATPATCALLEIMLLDSAKLQEQDAEYANRKGYSRHQPPLPLYTTEDAEASLELLRAMPFHTTLTLDALRVFFYPMGHILGSAAIEIQLPNNRQLLFSGDIGRYEDPIMRPPTEFPAGADYIVMESTYGDRLHEVDCVESLLTEAIEYIHRTQGVLLVPAFAVGRAQLLLYHIRQLQEAGRIPPLRVYVDSPMAQNATRLYCRFSDDLNMETSPGGECEGQLPLYCYHTQFVQSISQSKSLNTQSGPMVIISASGMCTGGRILHHLKARLPDPRNAVLFVGYQADGTRGRMLLDGATEITIHGEPVPVQARIFQTSALSAHADQAELLRWIRAIQPTPRQLFLTHGEPQARETLRALILNQRGWNAHLPQHGETVPL
ncbi:MAG: MBL fold metallo-hydrolase [Fimbriimonadales bacterium]|nr:MBL fold metallo-hydrolase [Fimbriimonadales bacterium]